MSVAKQRDYTGRQADRGCAQEFFEWTKGVRFDPRHC